MTVFVFDTETWPIQPALLAPPIVCGQWQTPAGPRVVLAHEFREVFAGALADPGATLVGHNAAYDMAAAGATWPDLLPAIFAAYREDRVTCTDLRERLILIGKGRHHKGIDYSLSGCLDRNAIPHHYNIGEDGKKDEYWRTRYPDLRDTPPEQWPEDALRYAREDARTTANLYDHQERTGSMFLRDQFRQARAGFWLHLASCWGLRTDPDNVSAFLDAVLEERDYLLSVLQPSGLVRPTGKRDTKAAKARMEAVCAREGLEVQLTDKGHVSLSADSCHRTGDEILDAYARYTTIGTLKARAQRLASAGSRPIQPRFNVLMETGRTSASAGGKAKPGQAVTVFGDQVQNLPRKFKGNADVDLRSCYVARDGFVIVSSDWSSAELHTLAQSCIYLCLHSRLAEVLNSGRDVHMWFGAKVFGWDYEEAQARRKAGDKEAKDARQMAKAANFGLPGGLGVATFREYAAATYGVTLSEKQARDLKRAWFEAFPEMREYFERVNRLVESGTPLQHFTSERFRGDLRFTSACNSFFQGLASDMAKDCGFDIAEACYVRPDSPLFGSRIVNFIHDEFLVEVPEARADECAREVVRLMEDAGRRWCPDVPVAAEPALCYHWLKAAEPAYDDHGRLIPWEKRRDHGE